MSALSSESAERHGVMSMKLKLFWRVWLRQSTSPQNWADPSTVTAVDGLADRRRHPTGLPASSPEPSPWHPFENEEIWRGKSNLHSSFSKYHWADKSLLLPCGGVRKGLKNKDHSSVSWGQEAPFSLRRVGHLPTEIPQMPDLFFLPRC